jgi:hypothetical protein
MSKIAYIKGFYDQFYKFLEEMIDLYPEDPDFRTFDTFLRGISKANPMSAVKVFHETSAKFAEKIDSRDESFFLKYDYTEYGGDTMDIIGKLSGYYTALTPESRKAIWEYLIVLKELSKRACTS